MNTTDVHEATRKGTAKKKKKKKKKKGQRGRGAVGRGATQKLTINIFSTARAFRPVELWDPLPSTGTLAHDNGVDPRTIRRYVNELRRHFPGLKTAPARRPIE